MTKKKLCTFLRKRILIVFIINTSIFNFSCNTTDSFTEQNFNLKVLDVSCTEAWLQLKTNNLSLPAVINILVNKKPAQVFKLNTQDTLLYIDSLLPNQTYTLQIVKNEISSNEVVVQTIDTTSHNSSWQTFTFGEHNSSVFFDVAVVNEKNIWAVGEIFLNDSLGQPDQVHYNGAYWNGNNWEIKRIPYFYDGYPYINRIQSVFAFSEKDVWFCGNGVIHFDGTRYIPVEISKEIWGPFQMNKIWGTSSNDLYVVGDAGHVAHFNGRTWKKIDSGTDVNLTDVYGTPDGSVVWVTGFTDFKPTVLLKIVNLKVETIFNSRDYLNHFYSDHISGVISSVWTNNSNFVYVTTQMSLYRKSIYNIPSTEEALRFGDLWEWLGNRTRGSGINNLFIVGYRGKVNHYNGITFNKYQGLSDVEVMYYGLDVKSKNAACCGLKNSKAIITLFK